MAARKAIFTGVRSIDRKLHKLSFAAQKKVVRPAIREGLKVIQAEVKSRLPREKDAAIPRSAVKVRTTKPRARNRVALDVRISGVANPELKVTGKGGITYFLPALEEYGSHGVPANPFMRRSFEAAGKAARGVTMRRIKLNIAEEARKL
jgi:HK97 gp10 family phage protein